eukprot:CAMPEP_0206461174 /NCGR_PEP_ID=MMETSP0324_2-20121206/25197_1 /ASSEMBLY_ACC=CAM_ASM_000836 /TAXON_ID=2866 /ORGANISM="Crypthecodinium cohnii, Strain Seligo" /LENGTH=312 /DNA_ID=CAMNT_0053933031 /DNA_START=68 /DNA_END=1006 /DNA_ORIENTATION=-
MVEEGELIPEGENTREVFFVGVAGPSGSGKTTLAEKLAEELKSPFEALSLDDYIVQDWQPWTPKWGRDRESPKGIDFRAFCQDLDCLRDCLRSARVLPSKFETGTSENSALCGGRKDRLRKGLPDELGPHQVYVVIEGFLLFWDEDLVSNMSCCLWLEPTVDVCCSRRMLRSKGRQWLSHPSTSPEQRAEWQEWYYKTSYEWVWTSFLDYREQQLRTAREKVFILDLGAGAGVGISDLCQQALTALRASSPHASQQTETLPASAPPTLEDVDADHEPCCGKWPQLPMQPAQERFACTAAKPPPLCQEGTVGA